MKTNTTELGARLRAWRLAQGLTQAAAAARLRCDSIDTYRGWERGKRSPSQPMAAAILAVIESESEVER
jgi:transcriptional regulator with XRE-family HTH domain